MLFWICLYVIVIFLCIFSIYITENLRGKIIFTLFMIIWFIASFRYMIGTDYIMYMVYYQQDIFLKASMINDDATELATLIITLILKSMGFGSQMFFLVYETITLLFLYLGGKYYAKDTWMFILFFSLYIIIHMPGTFFWSMNVVRQAAAISIIFWGSKFWIEEKWIKWIASIALGGCFHFTVLIIVPVFIMSKILLNYNVLNMKRISVSLMFATACTFCGISSKTLFMILENLPVYGEKYGKYLAMLSDNSTPTLGLACFLLIVYFIVSRYYFKSEIDVVYKNVYYVTFIFMCIRLLTSFKLNMTGAEHVEMVEAMLHRVDAYLVLFFIVTVSFWLHQKIIMQRKKAYVYACVMILMLFTAAAVRQHFISEETYAVSNSPSAGNINYDFRFDLIGE